MTASHPRAASVAEALVIATVCLLPWAFGGVESWAWRGAAVLLVAGCAVWVAFGGGASRLVERPPPWLLPAILLCGWAVLQTVPLPPAILRVVSPRGFERVARALPGFADPAAPMLAYGLERQAMATLPPDLPPGPDSASVRMDLTTLGRAPLWHAVSVAPTMTAECAGWYGALLAAALVASWSASERGAWRRWRAALFATFTLLAVVGLLQKATWNGALLWIRPVEGGRPFGPYVNGIHFAGMMEMGVPWMAAYALGRWTSRVPGGRFGVAAILAGAVVAFLAGLAAQSKMAAVLMAVGLSIIAVARSEASGRARVAIVVAGSWVVGATAVLLTPLGERFRELGEVGAAGLGDYERIVAWKALLPAIREFWICGTGYGTFRYVAPAYLPTGEGSGWLQLHNDWLESALSGGLIGLVLLVALTGVVVAAVGARVRGPGARGARFEQLGMAIGLASLAVHAVVDFNHQIPANALMFVTIAAIAVSGAPDDPTEE